MVKYFSSYSLSSLPRQTAVLPESQSTQNPTNEQENAGMSLLEKHRALGFFRTGKLVPCSFDFCVSRSLGKNLRASSSLVVLPLKGGKVCSLLIDSRQIVGSLFLACGNFST